MAGFDGPQHEAEKECEIEVAQNARIGMILFFVYFALYAGFMGLAAFAPKLMASRPLGGVCLSVLYGFGLIIAALVLAFIYMASCRASAAASKEAGR